METSYDAIVVGGGVGGGATACRLAMAGWRVCVLERGRRFSPGDFPDQPADAPRAFFDARRNPGGLYDLRIMKDVAVLTAAGVGGGSLIYANVQLRAPADVFGDGWPSAITRESLDPYYDRTEQALTPRTTPDEPPLPKVAAFAAAGQLLGRPAQRLPIAVHFGEPREHPFSGVAQQGCANVGRCDIGCPVRAKNTVDITYLARAEAEGAEVFPLCDVRRLDPPAAGAGGRWKVTFRNLQYRNSGTVEAPVVVLSAGTLGSTRLLLKNRRRLPDLSPALGSRFSGNGDALGLAFDPQAQGVAGGRHDYGPTMTSGLFFEDEKFVLADGGLPANFGGLLEIVRHYDAITGWKRGLVRLKDLAARLGFSDQPLTPREVPRRLPKRPGRAPITDSLVFLMFGRDAANGRMRLTPLLRRLDIAWRKEDSQALWDAMEKATNDLAAAVAAEPFFALDAGPLGKFITVHPLGGCPMADDPRRGVVDDGGKVHGYDGLYVADGAIVPTALGVNPSKTIAALAERAAERLVASR